MVLVIELTFLVAGLIILGFASTRLVRVINTLSAYARFPKFFLSFVVLGFGTSLPDVFIAAFASSRNELPLVLGSIIGSNTLILTLILGVIVVAKGEFRVREKTVLENFGWIFFVLMIPFFLLIDGRLTFFEGVILVIVYLMYVYNVTEQEAFFRGKGIQTELVLGDESPYRPKFYKTSIAKEILKAAALLAVVLLSAEFAVSNGITLSDRLGVPKMFIGFSVIALGVTLPELALNLSALRAKEEEVIWGDIIGSFITELTLVLGVAALFTAPFEGTFSFSQTIVGYAFMAISFIAVFFFAFSKKNLTKNQGIALILLYLIFLSLQLDLLVFGGIRFIS